MDDTTARPCGLSHLGPCPAESRPHEHRADPRGLSDLLDRLQGAKARLGSLQNSAAAMHNTSEYKRLVGKEEGINLAISYLEEGLRAGGDDG